MLLKYILESSFHADCDLSCCSFSWPERRESADGPADEEVGEGRPEAGPQVTNGTVAGSAEDGGLPWEVKRRQL